MKHTTLSMAHKIKTLRTAGLTLEQVAEKTGTSRSTVQRVLAGRGMLQQRAIADRMEAFIGGVILGNGNLRFHASEPNAANDFGDMVTLANHPTGESWENGEKVPEAPCTLTMLLAEEDLITRLQDAGIDPDEIMIIDHESDVEEGTRMDDARQHRDPEIHSETWEEFMTRAGRDMKEGGNLAALVAFRLETEGQEVDVWAVRDIDFDGWPAQPWCPELTNDSIYRKRTS